MSENLELSGKQIASFIVLSLAISTPIAMAQDNVCNEELLADASVMIQQPQPIHVVNPPVARYAGPEYFGFGFKGDIVKPEAFPQQLPPVQDTAQYMQVQSSVLNDANANTKIDANTKLDTVNINNIKSNSNFINTEYGSVRVIEPSGHYIFK